MQAPADNNEQTWQHPRDLSPPIAYFDSGHVALDGGALAPAQLEIPTRTPVLDARILAAQPVLDERRRVGVKRLATALGWDTGRVVSYETGPGRLMFTALEASATGTPTARLDNSWRLTLSPAMCYELGAQAGEQLQAVADLRTHELVLVLMVQALHHLLAERSHAGE